MQLEIAKRKSLHAFQNLQTHWKSRGKRFNLFGWLRSRSLIQLALVPIALAGVYFFAVARDRFAVESSYVVRRSAEDISLGGGSTSGLAGLLAGSSQNSLEDARYLRTYLTSPQVLEDLLKTYEFDTAYAQRPPDLMAGLPAGSNREDRLEFFRKQVQVQLDEISGVITLTTVGLTPKAAYQLNNFLLKQSEQFVNRLNQKIGEAQLQFARKELVTSQAELDKAKQRLVTFQSAIQTIDPKVEAEIVANSVGGLELKLSELKLQRFTLEQQYKSKDEPDLLAVQDQIEELQRLIQSERKGLVSRQGTGKNLNEKAVDMIQYQSAVEFAADMYKTALVSAEKARVDTQRQQKFMAILSAPLMPDSAAFNWRLRGFFTVAALALVGLSLGKFALGVQDSHRE
jgi:capsular polysaccharide transport system permease protein